MKKGCKRGPSQESRSVAPHCSFACMLIGYLYANAISTKFSKAGGKKKFYLSVFKWVGIYRFTDIDFMFLFEQLVQVVQHVMLW